MRGGCDGRSIIWRRNAASHGYWVAGQESAQLSMAEPVSRQLVAEGLSQQPTVAVPYSITNKQEREEPHMIWAWVAIKSLI